MPIAAIALILLQAAPEAQSAPPPPPSCTGEAFEAFDFWVGE